MSIRCMVPLGAGLLLLAQCPFTGHAAEINFAKSIEPLLTKHCLDCHGGDKPAEGLDLSAAPAKGAAPFFRDINKLDAVALRVRSHTMPPPDEGYDLSEPNRELLLQWLEQQSESMVGGESNPGRVTIRRLTRRAYRNTVRDLLGVEVDISAFPSDDVAHGFDNLADVISLPPLLMEQYLLAAEEASRTWFVREFGDDAGKRPTADQRERDVAAQTLLPLMKRAFRRPTSAMENHFVLHFFEQCEEKGFSFDEAMQASVMRILISPPFLYRMEQDGSIGQSRPLDDYELATRLSYFLWSSMPDEELFALADQGALQQGDTLQKQVRRMLQDDKIRDGLVADFAGQWLQTQRLEAIRPDDKMFPQFDDALRQAMAQESLLLFEHVVRQDLPVSELLFADYTFLNERLAKHYGINGVKGNDFVRVSLQGQPRQGLLTHAGVLAINSHPTETSPVLRGKWIMEAMLGTKPPPPPADVAELDAVAVKGTLRVRLEAHRADPKCASCHKAMDAYGLAFENYDPIGRWRTQSEGQPIDASGELGETAKFNNALELIQVMRKQRVNEFRNNIVKQLYTYAIGRTPTMHDRLPLRKIARDTAAGDDLFTTLVLSIVESPPFRARFNFGRIGLEQVADTLDHTISGNPDQQAVVTIKPAPGAAPPENGLAAFELHTLKPLLGASTPSGKPVKVGKPQGGKEEELAFRYPIEAPVDEPLHFSFMEGMIGPNDYSVDYVRPIALIQESDEEQIVHVADSSHSWNAALTGPRNIRPGSVLAFDFDVKLVAKPSDTLNVFPHSLGAANNATYESSDSFNVEGEGTHQLQRVSRRTTSTGDAWNENIMISIRTRTQTVVGNFSPLRVIRPTLRLNNAAPIKFNNLAKKAEAESHPLVISNGQQTVLVDHKEKAWPTILYGAARLQKDGTREYLVTNEFVGVELLGKDAGRFALVGDNASDDGKTVKLLGADGEPGLLGGPQGEKETFQVKFRGADAPGEYQAVVRIVTQAGQQGVESTGQPGEPFKGLWYVDIPVTATVK